MSTHRSTLLQTPIEYLKGVGPQRAALLAKELDIVTFGDLLDHFPYRYLDTAQVSNIGDLSREMEWVQLRGVVGSLQEEGAGYRKRLKAHFYDQTGTIELVWFQGAAHIRKGIQKNATYNLFGKLSYFNGIPSIAHPELELYDGQAVGAKVQPVYPTTESLKAKGLSNRAFARLLQSLCQKITADDIPEFLPEAVLTRESLCTRYEAYRSIHFPADGAALQQAIYRLKWEELFLLQLRLAGLKRKHRSVRGRKFATVGQLFNEFYHHHLPFSLTNAQKRVLHEIRADTLSGHQMNRLLQGDVGSGKTMVALLSMLLAVDNGFQASLMAPTEVLAQQHYDSIRTLLAPLQIPVALLTGSVKGKQRKELLYGIATGVYPIVIGTHALVEETVVFERLGLAVIDEQHRFGVGQRARLWQKDQIAPHILVMTATPIPRTLAMSIYGDLDVSTIDELPPGRQPVQTIHRTESFRPKVMQFLKGEITKGRQIYIVYPLIEESEKLDYESLLSGIDQVKAWFPEPAYRVAMVHGRQPADERQRNMDRFVKGKAHILVATTVIEVGVNVPNASVMIIESAERFGLSQLHQLRGRVGRGSEKSYCILLTGSKISNESRSRMEIMTRTNDGFQIAEEDLRLRGPGDIYGTRQSGALQMKIADIIFDGDIMAAAQKAARLVLEVDPELVLPAHQLLKMQLAGAASQPGKPTWSRIS